MQSKRKFIFSVGIICFLLGAGILLYPAFSNWYMTTHQGKVIRNYQDKLSHLTDAQMRETEEAARIYNEKLFQMLNHPNELQKNITSQDISYEELLNISADGMMGYIEIPKIKVYLPIYHGTSQEILAKGAGHLFNSSLPVGGASCHCVISAHCGDPSAQFFTHLDELETGDRFQLLVLNQTRIYEVDQIKVVLPENTEDLQIIEDKDYVTLITCTPYGINSHRLLVRGHRIWDQEKSNIVEADGQRMVFSYMPYGLASICLILLGVAIWLVRRKGKG